MIEHFNTEGLCMDLIEHAKYELELLEKGCKTKEDLYAQKEITKDVLSVLNTLCDQGHSGFSASYIISLIDKLWDWKPLKPLTGEEDEWEKPEFGLHYQNKRCPAVFKESMNSKAYYLDGIIYVDRHGASFTCNESKVYIDFPYIPKSEYRKLFFPETVVPVGLSNKLHLYKVIK